MSEAEAANVAALALRIFQFGLGLMIFYGFASVILLMGPGRLYRANPFRSSRPRYGTLNKFRSALYKATYAATDAGWHYLKDPKAKFALACESAKKLRLTHTGTGELRVNKELGFLMCNIVDKILNNAPTNEEWDMTWRAWELWRESVLV